MKIKNLLFVTSITFILFSGIEVKSQESEIEKIIKEVSVDTQKGAIFNYTYMMRFSYDRHRFGGRKFTRLYEAVLPSRYSLNRFFGHPLILLEDSERRVTEEQVRNSRQTVAGLLQKVENEEDKLTGAEKPPEDGGYWTVGFSNNGQRLKIDVLQLLKNSNFGNLQKIEVEGRNIILVEFTPKTGAVFEKPLAYLSKIEGQIRIDETDKRITAIEGYALGEFAKEKEKPAEERQKEAVFIFLQTKVGEAFWFPQLVRLNFSKHPDIFESVEIEYAFSGYKKGNVEVQYVENATEKPGATTTTTTKEQ